MGTALLEGLKNLLASEKAIAAGTLAICATVLVVLGHMTVDQWSSYTLVTLGIYTGGKTLQGSVATWAEAKRPDAEATTKVEIKTTESHAGA